MIVEILTAKYFAINRLNATENGGVEVTGRILMENTGLYAARICLLSSIQANPNAPKVYATAAPEHMVVDEIKSGQRIRKFSIIFS